MQRMTQRLQHDRAAGRGSLMPFVTAGSPSLEATVATIKALDGLGVAAIEVGFPSAIPSPMGLSLRPAWTGPFARERPSQAR